MMRRNHHFRLSDEAFEALLRRAHDAEIADLATRFDAQAGLADVYARAGRVPPATTPDIPTLSGVPVPATEPLSGSEDETSSAVDDVCDHIEMIDTLLAAIGQDMNGPIAPRPFLGMARQFLFQLRLGLKARKLSRYEAFSLLDNVRHDLQEADRALRIEHGLSLEQALHQLHERIGELQEVNTDLTQQIEILHQKVMRLFDGTDHAADLVPVLH
jgi:hypothetical protein